MDINMKGIIWGLEELSDQSEQERLWAGIGNDGSEMSSFVEAVCRTFDDTGLSWLLDKGRASELIPPAQIDNLKQLSLLCGSIPNHLSPIEQIAHPVMVDIRLVAAEVLANLRSH